MTWLILRSEDIASFFRLLILALGRALSKVIVLIRGENLVCITLLKYIFKHFCKAIICFRAYFVIVDAILISESLCLLFGDLSLINQLRLVTDQDSSCVLFSVCVKTFNPISHAIEAGPISKVKTDYDTIHFPVKWLSHCFKPLLTSGVPYFYRDFFAVCFRYILFLGKVHSQLFYVVLKKLVGCVLIDDLGLIASSISKKDYLNLSFLHF